MSESYYPQFTSISSVSALTGESITDSTDPDSDQVLQWIEEVESEMIKRGFYQETLTGVTMDIPEGNADYERTLSKSWIYDDATLISGGLTVTLPHSPIISVDNVQRNLQGYQSDPDWEDLTEGPASGSDFLIVKQKFRSGLLGIGLYFYNNAPSSGYQRLKLDYTWGYNLPTKVLQEYATARVSLMLLYAKYMRKEPLFNVDVAGMKTQLNKFTNVHQHLIERIETIEQEWIPVEVGAIMLP